jgi:hypothetical protein
MGAKGVEKAGPAARGETKTSAIILATDILFETVQ